MPIDTATLPHVPETATLQVQYALENWNQAANLAEGGFTEIAEVYSDAAVEHMNAAIDIAGEAGGASAVLALLILIVEAEGAA